MVARTNINRKGKKERAGGFTTRGTVCVCVCLLLVGIVRASRLANEKTSACRSTKRGDKTERETYITW